jgi:division protein CdvB (Snf7/Vps24/ESCRT-III family)
LTADYKGETMDIPNRKSEDKAQRDLGAVLNDMLDTVKSSYGEKMFNILYKRIEKTLDDFDKDVRKILEDIEKKDTQYFETLPDIKQKSVRISEWKKSEMPEEKTEETAGILSESEEADTDADQVIIERIEKRKG